MRVSQNVAKYVRILPQLTYSKFPSTDHYFHFGWLWFGWVVKFKAA